MPGLFNQIDNFTEHNQNEAKCSFCGQHARNKLVGPGQNRRARVYRTNLFIHMEGWVEVCEWCLEEGAKAIDWVSKFKAEKKDATIELLESEVESALEQMTEQGRTIASLAAELIRGEEAAAAKAKAAYDKGYAQAKADAALELADAPG